MEATPIPKTQPEPVAKKKLTHYSKDQLAALIKHLEEQKQTQSLRYEQVIVTFLLKGGSWQPVCGPL